ncbi:hypothetical protein EMCG_07116 [[Emmonsia] crescens]|uniref:Uncharacterized protein n=1 Tax=[Emmonsia] crescens TaxID=73230 RepID=A0A0G2I9H9_9EURO|nr:hypothetical protein EMCG_07116 [Emmonsia crescens UAMH 3008]
MPSRTQATAELLNTPTSDTDMNKNNEYSEPRIIASSHPSSTARTTARTIVRITLRTTMRIIMRTIMRITMRITTRATARITHSHYYYKLRSHNH